MCVPSYGDHLASFPIVGNELVFKTDLAQVVY
jgi:hypothetical protein